MSADAIVFLLILLINTLLTFLYWLYFFIIQKKYEAGFGTRCIVMLLCPVIGPVYFVFGWFLRKIFFHKPVDLADVIFSKERQKSLLKANEDRENNILPIKDAVTVVDKQNARELMLEILRHDVRKSLSSLFLALNSDDSEISHYAASVLQSELGKFRIYVQNIAFEIDQTEAELREYEKNDGDNKTPAGIEYSKRLAELSGKPDEDVKQNDDRVEGRKKAERNFIFADLSDKLEESEDYYRHEISAHEQGMRAYFGDDIGEMTIHQKLIEQADKAHKLIDSIYGVLKQNVLSEMESIHFTALANNRNYSLVFSFN